MNMNKLERKFGRYAIPNLSLVIIAAYALGYILQMIAANALSLLCLDPYLILHGQVWRLISWVLIPPSQPSIFTMINLLFFFSVGRTLEMMWGDFRYNVFIFAGLIFLIIGSFCIYGFGCVTGLLGVNVVGPAIFSSYISQYITTYYINTSMIMAFAMTIPDMQVLLYFIIPLKMKYLAYAEAAFLAIDFFRFDIVGKCIIVLSILNFVIFYFSARKGPKGFARAKTSKRRFSTGAGRGGFTVYRGDEATGQAPSAAKNKAVTRHKCAICGRTELDSPNLSFRFCSKCNGNYEYCEDHLFTHTHVE